MILTAMGLQPHNFRIEKIKILLYRSWNDISLEQNAISQAQLEPHGHHLAKSCGGWGTVKIPT